MVNVGDIRAELSLIYSQFKRALKDVEKLSTKTGKTMETVLGTKLNKNLQKTGAVMSKTFGGKTQKNINATGTALDKLGSQTYGYFKDIGRIAQGILVSQILYRGILQPIQEATRALWQFMVEMEQAYLALDIMLGGLSQATIFLRELESFAAVTPFQMGDVVTGTRRLLGYGFAAQEILPILEAMADAMSIVGVSPEGMQQLLTVMGKIRATGRMTAREIRSFGAAGIPIFQILREELGLTNDEIRNIGRQAEGQANVVIPAILRGLERKFGGAAERLQRTIGGLLSTLQDDMLLIARDVFGGLYETFRGFLAGITDRLEELRDIVVKFGVGGLFEALIPEGYQEILRQIIAHLISFGRALSQLWQAIAPVRQLIFDVFIKMMGMIAPILNVAATALAKFAYWAFYSNTILGRLAISLIAAITLMKMFTIVLGIAHAISKLAVMVGLASTAMNKWGIIIMIVLTALIALAMSIPKVRNAIKGLWDQLMNFFGLDTSTLLRPIEIEDVIDEKALDEQLHVISEGTQQVTEDLEDVEDQIEDTQKALKKYLLAFDEVYAIPEKYPKLAVPEIGELAIPEIPEMMFEPEMEWPDWVEPAEVAIGDLGDLFEGFGAKVWDILKRIGTYIKEALKIWWQTVKELWSILWQFIKDFAGAFIQFFKDIWNAAKQFVLEIWRAYRQLFIDLVQAFWTFIKDVWAAIKELGKALWEAFKTFFKELISAKTFMDVVNAFKNLYTNIFKAFYEFGRNLGAAWKTWIISVGKIIINFSKNIIDAVMNLILNLKTAYSNLVKNLINTYRDFFVNTFKAILNYYTKIGELIANLFPSFFEAVKPHALKITGWLLNSIMNIGQKINSVFFDIGEKVKAISNNILDFIRNMVNMVIELLNKIPGVDIAPIKTGIDTSGVGVGTVPGMAQGGILNKEQIVRAAEAGKPEAYTPLTAAALKPWAEAIASALGDSGDGAQAPSIQELSYVAVPIDKKGMMDLDRKLFVIRKKENIRTSKGVGA